jgi:hypothetical protein
MRRTFWVFPFAVALGCSSNVSGTISLITGYGETDPFTEAPAPTSLQLSSIAEDGGITLLGETDLPADAGLSLPTQSTNTTAAILANGFDDAGDAVLWGETLQVEFSSLEGLTLPLFVQRTEQFSRLPSPFTATVTSPLAALLDGRFVLAIENPPEGSDASVDGGAAGTQLYDLLTWAPLGTPPALPVAPVAIATVGTQVLLVSGQNTTWYDFSDSEVSAPAVVAGATFAGISGGVTVTDPVLGDQYIVVGAGAPAAQPSASMVYVNADVQLNNESSGSATQSVYFPALITARSGAAVTWASGTGVVIAGGIADGTAPAQSGVEAIDATQATGPGKAEPVGDYPFDDTTGAGATALDPTHVLLVGGVTPAGHDAGARVIDLQCTTGCVPMAWNAPLSTPLVTAQAFTLDSQTALVVGNDASNDTHAYRVNQQTGATEIAFKVPRMGATALALPMGPVPPVLVVGGDVTMESFVP